MATASQTLTLPANGIWVELNAFFEDETTCTATNGNAYFAPEACVVCPADINGNAPRGSDVLLVLSDLAVPQTAIPPPTWMVTDPSPWPMC